MPKNINSNTTADITIQNTVTKKSTKAVTKRNQLEGIYNKSLFTLIIHVLKTLSSKEFPMSVPDIINGIFTITGQTHSVNTVRRHMKDMMDIYNSDNDDYSEMKNAFIYSYGGIIRETNTSKARTKYYFEPLLTISDVNMLAASVTSNRYLDDKEKNYLNIRLKTLAPYMNNIIHKEIYSFNDNKEFNPAMYDAINSNAEEFFASQKININNAYNTSGNAPKTKPMLNIIRALDSAIHDNLQVKLHYGIYNYDGESYKLNRLKLTDRGKEYLINPYAMCWNNGSYYLICTNNNSDIPYHFRVDRIISVEITDNKCNEKPATLKKFFKDKQFQVEKYTKTYPYMSIYGKEDKEDCVFEISASALSILIDYFGKDIHIQKTDKEEPDYNGKMWPVLRAEISNIEYPCLKLFTIQHHQLLKVIKPCRLIDDLKAELNKSIDKYN